MARLPHVQVLEMLAQGIEEVCGADSEVYRDMFQALKSNEDVDLMLAQASFDALPGEKRRRIMEIVQKLASEDSGASAAR